MMGVQEEGARNPEEIPLPQSDEEGQEEAQVQGPLVIQEEKRQEHLAIQEEPEPAQHQELVIQRSMGRST